MFVPLLSPPTGSSGPELWFHIRRGELLVRHGPDGPEIPDGHAAEREEGGKVHFLGMLGERPCWAVGVSPHADEPDDHSFDPLRRLYGLLPEDAWTVAGRATQIVEWDRTHRFCGRCGSPTEVAAGERAMRCPGCDLLSFPRLSPAVIMLVERDGEALLACGRGFGGPMYSALAGFVEPGETLEEAVHREVLEEVSVTVRDVSYFGSQPWPFPHQLMIGFNARWDSGEIAIDESELVDAGWFAPDALPRVPSGMSIARRLIDDWLART